MVQRNAFLIVCLILFVVACTKDRLEVEPKTTDDTNNDTTNTDTTGTDTTSTDTTGNDTTTVTDACDTMTITYSGDIKSIIDDNCVSCHVSGGTGNGDFTTYSGVKAKVDNGTLETRVLDQKDMPPSSPLPEDEREKIRCWLEDGAPNN